MDATQCFMFVDGALVGGAFVAIFAAVFYASGLHWQKRAMKAESSLRIAAYLSPDKRLEWLTSSADALPSVEPGRADRSLERLQEPKGGML